MPHAGGVGDVSTSRPPGLDDHMKLASVSKAFNGAAVLAAVSQGRLGLDDTVASRLPGLPAAWGRVTVAQLLAHTSGIPDFSKSPEFQNAVRASPQSPPPPSSLLSSVAAQPLSFDPGSRYEYSNSDNVVAALIVEAVDGRPYASVLGARVFQPLGLPATDLPEGPGLPAPTMRGYDLSGTHPEDVTELLAGGWAWAAGGIVSTPADANRFVRAYAAGRTIAPSVRGRQLRFIPGDSEPPGPGTNEAGLAIYRYTTPCGVVYGHTGNTLGYTQFAAATADGARSATVTANAQVVPGQGPTPAFAALQEIFNRAVCAALAS